MSAWRRKALEFLPQFRKEIELADSVTGLWIDISLRFRDAVDEQDEDFIACTLKYLTWSSSDSAGLESQQAVSCGFLEDLTYNKKHWQYFSKWFDTAQFNQYKPSFKYALSEKEFNSLENIFYGK